MSCRIVVNDRWMRLFSKRARAHSYHTSYLYVYTDRSVSIYYYSSVVVFFLLCFVVDQPSRLPVSRPRITDKTLCFTSNCIFVGVLAYMPTTFCSAFNFNFGFVYFITITTVHFSSFFYICFYFTATITRDKHKRKSVQQKKYAKFFLLRYFKFHLCSLT